MPSLDFESSAAMLKRYGIRFPDYEIAKSPADASRIAKKLGYPVALKLISKEIVHKTDVGGVKLNIPDEKQLAAAYSEIAAAVPKAKLDGILVQKMAPAGVELLVGGKQDVQFGPVLAFGLGGIFVEIFKDVSLRICPIEKSDALELIREIKGYPILAGARNTKPVDEGALVDLLVSMSKLMMENKVTELDLNPVMAYNKGYLAVDVRIMV
ncbi:MAG: acetate--CoA ligase family protein [Candidatus Micrarchaeia archaeon]|jgi:acetyl-CoA synthetase (ADP-forming)